MNVTLYGYFNSPFVRKTGCFLFYKGVAFDHVPVDPLKPEKTIGFTEASRVPVLKIGDEWKRESSDHAYWLDDVFPDGPLLCPPEHRAKIQEIDAWISDVYLLNIFRRSAEGKITRAGVKAGWRLAALMNTNSPVPRLYRLLWPFILPRVPFIKSMAAHMDFSESLEDMNARILNDLVAHIGDGPFVGGIEAPTMLDMALYPNLVWPYLFGVSEDLGMAGHPVVNAWLRRVAEHLPENPSLTPDHMMVRRLSDVWMD